MEDTIGINNINAIDNDYDGNDVVTCNGIKATGPSLDEMTSATISIRSEAAGAMYRNALYVKNLCDGYARIQYKKFGWKLTPFKHVLTIKNISFSHYFTSGVAGRPISSTHVAHTLVSKLHCSSVQGHSHLYNHAEQTRPDGQKIFGLSGGCYSHPDYSENWCKDTEYQWWRGVIMLEGLDGEGYYNGIHAVTQRSIL